MIRTISSVPATNRYEPTQRSSTSARERRRQRCEQGESGVRQSLLSMSYSTGAIGPTKPDGKPDDEPAAGHDASSVEQLHHVHRCEERRDHHRHRQHHEHRDDDRRRDVEPPPVHPGTEHLSVVANSRTKIVVLGSIKPHMAWTARVMSPSGAPGSMSRRPRPPAVLRRTRRIP